MENKYIYIFIFNFPEYYEYLRQHLLKNNAALFPAEKYKYVVWITGKLLIQEDTNYSLVCPMSLLRAMYSASLYLSATAAS